MLFIREKVFGEWKQEDHELQSHLLLLIKFKASLSIMNLMSVCILQNCETSYLMKPTDLI